MTHIVKDKVNDIFNSTRVSGPLDRQRFVTARNGVHFRKQFRLSEGQPTKQHATRNANTDVKNEIKVIAIEVPSAEA